MLHQWEMSDHRALADYLLACVGNSNDFDIGTLEKELADLLVSFDRNKLPSIYHRKAAV